MPENENTENEKTEQPFYKTKFFWFAVLIFVLFLSPFVFLIIHSLSNSNKTEYNEKKVVERPVSAHDFAELKIVPKIPLVQAGKKFRFMFSRDVYFTGNMQNVVLLVKVPEDIPNRQEISNIQVSPVPRKITQKSDGRYAEIFLANPRGCTNISISGDAVVNTYNLETAQKGNKNIDTPLTEEEKKLYLREEKGIDTKSRFVHNIVTRYIPTATNEVDTVKNIFDYIVNNMTYDMSDINKNKGALEALHSGTGVCEEFSRAFVTLCRAKNIPARIVSGFDIPFREDIQNNTLGHMWAEVYFPEYGWVAFDPSNQLSDEIKRKAASLGILPYELLFEITKNKIYLTVDARIVAAKYEGEGSLYSKNLVVDYK